MEQGSSGGHRSEIELSTLPEVAAFATELTTLFKDLGITQQQYAIRTNFDKSYISRFLNGRRVATIEFVERLLQEVEKRRGVQVTEETRARIFHLRSRALRAFDPELHKLENLRYEVEKSQRDVKRLLLHQQALELLLEQRDSESDGLRNELLHLQSDWMADRVKSEAAMLVSEGERRRFEDEREEFRREIERLKQELRITISQKNRAENRCVDLESQVVAIEQRMAEGLEREGVDEIGLPIEYVQERILGLVDQASRSVVYRELSECAFSRPSRDIAQLCVWLCRVVDYETAEHLMVDYCRQRSAERVAQFILDIEELSLAGVPGRFTGSPVSADISRRSFDELAEFCRVLVSGRRSKSDRPRFVEIGAVASSWVLRANSRNSAGRAHSLIPIIDELLELGEREAPRYVIKRVAERNNSASAYLECIAEAGRWEIADMFVGAFVERASPRLLARVGEGVCNLPDQRMADLLMNNIRERFSISEICEIMVESLKDDNSRAIFIARLAREAVGWYKASELKSAISEHNVIFIGDDPEAQVRFDAARAKAQATIERMGK